MKSISHESLGEWLGTLDSGLLNGSYAKLHWETYLLRRKQLRKLFLHRQMQLNNIFIYKIIYTERASVENQSNSDTTISVLLAHVYSYHLVNIRVVQKRWILIIFLTRVVRNQGVCLEGREFLNVAYVLSWNSLNTG